MTRHECGSPITTLWFKKPMQVVRLVLSSSNHHNCRTIQQALPHHFSEFESIFRNSQGGFLIVQSPVPNLFFLLKHSIFFLLQLFGSIYEHTMTTHYLTSNNSTIFILVPSNSLLSQEGCKSF